MYLVGKREALRTLGLHKVAAVPGPVKQYRRAYEALTRGDKAFHGSHTAEQAAGILKDRHINPAGNAQYDPGVYFWANSPRRTNMARTVGDNSEGFMTDLERVEEFAPKSLSQGARGADDPYREHIRVWQGPDRKGTTPYPLKDKDTFVGKRTADREQNIRDAKLRTIDPAILHRARADVQAKNLSTEGYGLLPSDLRTPDKKELQALIKRKENLNYGPFTDPERFVDKYVDDITEV